MRIDHHAYQRATRIAGVGFLVQLGIGLALLLFSLIGGEAVPQDTAFLFASLYILLGLLAWLGLLVVFNQHKLERLEALEEDEFAQTRGDGAESVFAAHDEEIHVAARRLRLMHKWLMPANSLLIATGLCCMAWLMLRHMGRIVDGNAEFQRTGQIGWAVAIALAFAAVSFIVSRFVAGMSKLPAWQNLRGGAAYMVGNSLVTLAVAVGIGFRFFKNDDIIVGIAYAIPVFMLVVAAEIVLNFVLNLYRPRVPGETPRPAFDSKLLSMFAAPDNLVRSINEAINYQFGFDITSSWGYQLLIRSFAWLLGLGVLALVVLNMVVIVEPQQQAVKLRRGELVGNQVHGSGVMWKLPWPLESAEVYDVATIRELHLTGRQVVEAEVQLWTDDLGRKFDKPLEPFLVSSATLRPGAMTTRAVVPDTPLDDETALRISESLSLVDAEIVVQYRIREDGGLLHYLDFSSDELLRRERLTRREVALRAIALREIDQELSRLTIDDVLAVHRTRLPDLLRERVQAAFNAQGTGVDVVAVDLPLLRPAGTAASGFEELSMSYQARRQFVAAADERVVAGLAQILGDPDAAPALLAEIDAYNELSDELGPDDPKMVAQRAKVEGMLMKTGGAAAQSIAVAERDRWVRLMHTRAEANRLRGQVISYRAAPRLYREREKMIVYGNTLADLYKYVLCVDPARVNFDVELKELSSMFNIGDAFTEEELGEPK